MEPPDLAKIVMVQEYRQRGAQSMSRYLPGQFTDSNGGLEGWVMSIHKEPREIY